MTEKSRTPRRRIEFLDRPGLTMNDVERKRLVRSLRACAATCFDEIPEYQCLEDRPGSLDDKVITVVRDEHDRILGFASALVLDVEGVGDVLHMGLTCVHPDARGGGYTHKLVSRLVTGYLLRHRLLGKLWVTNVACVLSSLGNIALNFFAVHPSPSFKKLPRREHMKIADTVDRRYRKAIYIDPQARFDPEAFVFRGSSVRDTVFQKSGDDERYFHRNPEVNGFYRDRMRFDDGDEVLQVGYASLPALASYVVSQRVQKLVGAKRKGRRPTVASVATEPVVTRRAA